MIDFGRVHRNRPHLFADAVEIMCVFGEIGYVSKVDALTLGETSIRPADELLDLDEEDLDEDEFPDDLPSAGIVEKLQAEVDDCFEQLEYRAACLGDCYPFVVDGENLSLKAEISSEQFLYIFLLSASRTRTFKGSKGLTQKIASQFEEVCKGALPGLMPPSSEIVAFGSGSVDRRERFGTDLHEAVENLASFMGMGLVAGWNEGESKQGDGGIDLVGVQRLDETEGGWNVYIGQCAAQEDEHSWEKKRSEADIDYYRSWFVPKVKSVPVMFVPVCFRTSSGRWVNARFTDNVIFMDRVRIIGQLSDRNYAGEQLISFLRDEFSDHTVFNSA